MDLYYEIHGNGYPIVLIHSGGADHRDWTYIAPLLADHYKVVTFDGRGAGKSPDPTEDVNCMEDLKELLDHLNIHEAAIVGHSMGGQIAIDFTLQYPEMVSKLILIAPSLTGFNYSSKFYEYMNAINEAAPNIDKMIALSQNAALYRVVQASPHRKLTEDMLRHHIERSFQWPAFHLIWSEPPAAERLGELTTKTLFMIGTIESPDNVRVADFFRQHTSASIIGIPDADHMATLTHPDTISRHILSFMED